ncbi:MAG: DUF551 domain-containing protein [Planctomycetota bacterium]
MGIMKDFDIRIRNGGDDAIAAVSELMDCKIHDDVVRELRPWLAQRQWIPVTERLPDLHEHVIGWQQGWANAAEVWRGSKGQWLGGDFEPADEVTHWMPLPAPPADAK